jgi:septal ring factor EnvC (AmiA/AmiB activator)
MTSEEMQKAIEFLLEHQARLTASAEQDRQRLLKSEELISMLVQLAKLNDERMDSLEESRNRDETRLARVEEGLLVLVDLSKKISQRLDNTDDRLNALITVVEKHISEGND